MFSGDAKVMLKFLAIDWKKKGTCQQIKTLIMK